MGNENINSNDLKQNKTDLVVSLSKSTLGIIPYAGSFIGEIVGNIIPNQRIDRIAKFCLELENKIQELPSELISSLSKNEEFIDLLEESFLQASRIFKEERRAYIVNIIINGINDDSIEIIQSKQLLKILSELNDIEIIWLRYFHSKTTLDYNEFFENHKNVLEKVYAHIHSDEETLTKSAIQESYKEHLSRLELTSEKLKIDKKTFQPIYNRVSGKPEGATTNITILGKLLLKQIGLLEQISQKIEQPDIR